MIITCYNTIWIKICLCNDCSEEKRLLVINEHAFLAFTTTLLLTHWLQAHDGKQPHPSALQRLRVALFWLIEEQQEYLQGI